ncbi:DUF309 domain-containing protein [Limnofasciculus baicalensis]|uniref:DUF309 domain-containing protein n=1 Tax=Limnofasciculus baicalensis BBK-W-15 TaxID=2699891 RepID=A0AAE3GVG0_9CYAN|nr:DUF309 domain-containing protein [Limnofasciculus baicalensis]MCP2730797.1 DUF309 domain-containing protein [Limnofasciculus baicalensis BBK-W-15]
MINEFWKGVNQFNQEEFYACHDTFEALWMESVEPQKKFYQGILQIAVACYHLGNLNWRGTVILLGEGIGRLRDYQPIHESIDVTELITQSTDLLKMLQEVGAEQVADVVQQLTTTSIDSISEVGSGRIRRLPKITRVNPDL